MGHAHGARRKNSHAIEKKTSTGVKSQKVYAPVSLICRTREPMIMKPMQPMQYPATGQPADPGGIVSFGVLGSACRGLGAKCILGAGAPCQAGPAPPAPLSATPV